MTSLPMYPKLLSSLPSQPDRGLVSQWLTSARASGRCWRLLLAWWVLVLLPSLLMGWSTWRAATAPWADRLMASSVSLQWNVPVLVETLAGVGGPRVYAPLGLAAVLVLLVLSPWFTGMLCVSFRHPGVPRWSDLMWGGLREAPRMARMLVWCLALMALILSAAKQWPPRWWMNETISGQPSDVAPTVWGARGLILALLLLVHLAAEAGRAHFVVQPRRRSAVMAWFRGLKDVMRRPLRVLALYLGLLAAGVVLWSFFHAVQRTTSAITLTWVVGQLALLALVWSRVARLRAMVELARVARR